MRPQDEEADPPLPPVPLPFAWFQPYPGRPTGCVVVSGGAVWHFLRPPSREDRMGVPAADATAFGGGWAEPDYVALGRSYALVGNWSKWQRFDELRMQLVDGRSIFVAEVPVPGNDDVEFQVICDGDWNLRMFPAVGGTGAGGGRVLGPAPGGHGHNWRLRGLRQPAAGAVLHVRLDPVGERSLQCRLEQAAAPQVAAGCA
ncbi:unnamed protein product [Prorocentrum cordatum]|uniref:Galectin n=1 Tax=Prorocentrum cordatum TaxID=2364126 RepID=A0ABN9V3J8_9DINO|nr:unnamed protein product [Polarella glacialis]